MKKIKVGLLVEEFFDKDIGGYGGYGILAREYIAKYIPNEELEIEVIVGSNKSKDIVTIKKDETKIHYLPRKFSSKFDIDFIYLNKVKKFFQSSKFDIYLSIETSKIMYEVMKIDKDKKLILWIQDPRPSEDWKEIKTVSMSNEYDSYINYYSKWENKIIKILEYLNKKNQLIVISQGKFLMKKAIELYKLPEDIKIKYFPNPITLNTTNNITLKKNSVIFLGRLTAVKRPWLYFELSKRIPEMTFYVCGQGELLEENKEKFKNTKNLKFLGHVSGEEKEELLNECKILVNTSIHEAIPVSFLEAISYGLYIVSCQNPDNIVSDYGVWTGTILGDGFDEIELFVEGIKKCMETYNEKLLSKGKKYIEENNSIEKFKEEMRKLIRENL